MKKIIILIAIALIIISPLRSEKRYSDYFFSGGLALNGNIYFSDFNQLPGTVNCNSTFSSAFGLGLGFHLGSEYIVEGGLFGRELRFGANVAYQNLSADYAVTEDFANIITGNSYVKAKVEHTINPSVSAFVIEPVAIFYPLADKPLGIIAGLSVAVPVNAKYTQKEQILSPSNIRYVETNTNTRNNLSGDLPERAAMLFGLSIGARYDLYNYAGLTFSPELKYNYNFNNIVKSIDWKISTLSAGITVIYRLPLPDFEPAKIPPYPPLPAPPIQSQFALGLSVKAAGKELASGETLFMPVREVVSYNKYLLLPTIFFTPGTTDLVKLDKIGLRTEELAQSYSLAATADYLADNPSVTLHMESSELDFEPESIVAKRIENTIAYFNNKGISKDRISFDRTIKRKATLNYTELQDDYCYLRFDFSDKQKALSYYADTIRKAIPAGIALEVNPSVSSDGKISKFEGEISESGKILKSFNQSGTTYEISNESNKNLYYNILALASANDGNSKSVSVDLTIKPKVEEQIVYENLITDLEDENRVRQYSLGFFEFDGAEFYSVNYPALSEAKRAVAQGAILEIIPLVDNFGTDDHNKRLAQSRANSALKLIGIDRQNAIITIPDKYFFSNDLPYGRMLNRAVIIRIKSK
jgi:hypothetical protein